jgi:hypothetical protein
MAKLKGKDVLETEFFEDDLIAFDEQVIKTEELYNEVHDAYKQVTGGDGASFKMMRDASELAKTLSSIRSTSIDAINKRFQMKRSVSDLEQKKQQLHKDDQNAAEIARATVMAIRNSVNKNPDKYINSSDDMNTEELNVRLKSAIDNKEITLSDNEKAMKYDFEGAEIVYNKASSRFMAITKSGEVVETYPQERVIDREIAREEDGFAITASGARYRVI